MVAIGNKGFTLIELLIVVAIIGVLAGIAIPQFTAYRQKGYDGQAVFDLRTAATAEEAYYTTHLQYVVCGNAPACITALPGLTIAPGTYMAMDMASTPGFTGTATSNMGTGVICHWDSTGGGFLGCR